jgi:cold shock CspA family protein
MQEAYVGVVKWFNAVKGFGFIGRCANTSNWPLDGDKDIFVHYSGIANSGYKKLNQHDVVEFSVEDGNDNRLQAIQVKLVTQNENQSQPAS